MLSVVGLSYRSAPVELREKVAVGETELPAVLGAIGHGVLLSTCNRTELYFASGPEIPTGRSIDTSAATRFFGGRARSSVASLAPYLYALHDFAAISHLYAVAASLDSLVLGEPQILGQVRRALLAAQEAGTAGPVLARAFHEALRVGRRARNETFIGRHAVSVSYAAVELARQVFGRLAGCRALVVGAGEMGALTARTLIDQGVGVVAVANRTLAHAEDLTTRIGGRAMGLDDLVPALVEADIVISSTDAPTFVIQRTAVAAALAERGGRPLFLIDIAVPRDVDPGVRALPGVHLFDMDDLHTLCETNREVRREEVSRVEAIIDEESARFVDWWHTRQAVPTVVALRERAEEIRREELAEALAALRHLGDAERQTIEALSRAIVNKLLHTPTVRLKAAPGDEGTLAAARALFGLD